MSRFSKLAAALLFGAAALAGCERGVPVERPPMDSKQTGYRGTGMVQITNPRITAPVLARWRGNRDLRWVLDGLNAASLALMAVVTLRLAPDALAWRWPSAALTTPALAATPPATPSATTSAASASRSADATPMP